jgi:hypothetical protein
MRTRQSFPGILARHELQRELGTGKRETTRAGMGKGMEMGIGITETSKDFPLPFLIFVPAVSRFPLPASRFPVV